MVLLARHKSHKISYDKLVFHFNILRDVWNHDYVKSASIAARYLLLPTARAWFQKTTFSDDRLRPTQDAVRGANVKHRRHPQRVLLIASTRSFDLVAPSQSVFLGTGSSVRSGIPFPVKKLVLFFLTPDGLINCYEKPVKSKERISAELADGAIWPISHRD